MVNLSAAAFMAALKYFFDRMAANMAIRQGFEDLVRQVGDEVTKHRGKIAAIQSSGKQAYSNVLFQIGESSSMPVGEAVSGAHAPVVVLERFQISESNLNLKHEDENTDDYIARTKIHRWTRSFEISVSDEEVATFRFIMIEIKRWESAAEPDIMKNRPRGPNGDRKKWRLALVMAFGPLVEPRGVGCRDVAAVAVEARTP